ncbi:MAG: EAL domain-containing protein [Campylobacterota bacterium]|nr:EAL domain-containing protein [Campylobacterota bacterium]
MVKNHSFWKRQIDRFLLLLIFFAFLLSFLFTYLYKIDKEVENYGIYQQKLEKMVALDLKLENYFLKTFRFMNSDEIVEISKIFEDNILFFKQSGLKKEFGQKSYDELLSIDKAYQEKINLMQQFQSPNARATNAIHYLYDLRKTVEQELPDANSMHLMMDQLLFELGKVLMGLPVDRDTLSTTLKQLKNRQAENRYFDYFYRQVRQFLYDADLIGNLLVSNKKIHLLDTIEALSNDLMQKYDKNRQKQKIITLSFFMLAFLILVILFFNYRRVRQTSLELKAFRFAIENSDNTIVITDADRHIQYINEAFERNSGYKKSEVVGQNPNVLKSGLLGDDFYRIMNETLDRGEKWQGELINRRKDGTLLYEKASIMPIIVNGELVQYLAIKLNITEYIETQQRLQQSAVAFETIGDGVMITDDKKKIISVNPIFLEMFGYTEEELIGEEPVIVSNLKQDSLFYKKLWTTLMTKNRWSGKVEHTTKSGGNIPIWLTVTAVRDKDGEIQNFIAIYKNLEDIIEMEERADFLAYHDSLTRLPNRAHVERELTDIFDLARAAETRVAILFIDLDRFKVINDTLGHHIGDGMLVTLAERLKNIVSANDLLARFGGDEFVVIMSGVHKKEDVSLLAKKILLAIREMIVVKDYHLNTTASIGIALFPEDGEDISSVVKHADAAMYYAKDKGKDNYQFYTKKLSVDMHTRLDLEQKLLHAIDRDELYVVYQPQYDLKSRRMCGVEALIRWESPELGHISPEEFISVAEETGVIVQIGYFVLEEASKAYMDWKSQGVELDWMAINLSSIQFRQEDMLKNFIEIIERTGIPPKNLEMEITERCVMDHTEANLTVLDELRKMGATISIDDFGTGYSSMSHLKTLPLDNLKIDKSFVDNIPIDDNDKEVSIAIIALSHSLGYKVIAEGIENREQEDFLREQGCDYGQGYYFSRPLKSEALMHFIKNH